MPPSVFDLPLQHQRDLWWSLYGPSLLSCVWCPASAPLIDAEPPTFPDWLFHAPAPSSERRRLGFLFEQVWQQFFKLQHFSVLANVAIRQPIQTGQRHEIQTLGELDLLVNDGQQQTHIEVALKFYLGTPSNWFGPDSRDCLNNKIQHLAKHQLPLSSQPVAQAHLHNLGWAPTQSIAIVRGCLFYPAHGGRIAPLAAEVNAEHWRGRWCYVDEMEDYLPAGQWAALAKPQWISPALLATDSEQLLARSDLMTWVTQECERTQTPICVAHLQPYKNSWAEQERWFIAPRSWPRAEAESAH